MTIPTTSSLPLDLNALIASSVPPERFSKENMHTDTVTEQNVSPAPDIVAANSGNPEAALDEDYTKKFDFSQASVYLRQLEASWVAEQEKTKTYRLLRYVDIDVKALRAKGDISPDETFIPDRTIDTNIKREIPALLGYIKNSRRIVTFRDTEAETQNTNAIQKLEEAFTQGMTYPGWETPHFKVIDGSEMFGWDSYEVVFDPDKPLHVSLEHCGHDELFFPTDALKIQNCGEGVIRIYNLNPSVIKSFVQKFGFNPEQVRLLLERVKDSSQQDSTIRIYKRYCKYNGIVYVSWYSLNQCTDWLLAPKPYSCGISEQVEITEMVPRMQQSPMMQADGTVSMTNTVVNEPMKKLVWQDKPLTNYPIFLLPYEETEQKTIFAHKGRVFFDKDKQEALTALITAYVNRSTRSAKVYGAPTTDNGDGKSLQQADIKLSDGTILSKPFAWFVMPPPDPSMLMGGDYISKKNTEETGQVEFSVINRKDARKTSKEMELAQDTSSLIKGVQVSNYSTVIREMYNFVWSIVQAQALQDLIVFLPTIISEPQIDPLTGQPMIGMDGQPILKKRLGNNVEVISRKYEIRAAGDVDVIKRDETLNKMRQDWPVIQATPLATKFLADYLKLSYADDGANYAKILEEGAAQSAQAMLNLIQTLATLLKEGTTPEELAVLAPEQRMKLQQIFQQVDELLKANKVEPRADLHATPGMEEGMQ